MKEHWTPLPQTKTQCQSVSFINLIPEQLGKACPERLEEWESVIRPVYSWGAQIRGEALGTRIKHQRRPSKRQWRSQSKKWASWFRRCPLRHWGYGSRPSAPLAKISLFTASNDWPHFSYLFRYRYTGGIQWGLSWQRNSFLCNCGRQRGPRS